MIAAVRKLEEVFGEIARTRMADVPIVNPAVRVEAIGFREWEGRRIGVLVTPWTVNLVLLPGAQPLAALGLDEKTVWTFPSGAYHFMGLNEPALGTCHSCPLISPVPFATHEDAVAVAHEIMAALFEAPKRDDDLAAKIEDARIKGEAVSQQQMSRRGFLRLPFSGSW
ncbi:MAG TPA: [NiFe]-hydrogenase assembly chaperone HybE [Gallionella sp.]|nr:[NiFe]-hydrogenase assembly chaperone HybE [Gallionella sp.]